MLNNGPVIDEPLQAVFNSALTADSREAVVKSFYDLTGMPAVVVDMANHVAVASGNGECDFGTIEDELSKAELPPDVSGCPISQPVVITAGGENSWALWAIYDGYQCLMKLAVCVGHEPDRRKLSAGETLAKGLYSLWLRLRLAASDDENEKGSYLRSLIQGNETRRLPGFGEPYIIAVTAADTGRQLFRELGGRFEFPAIWADNGGEYVLLMSRADEAGLSGFESAAKSRGAIVGLSQQFADLSKAPSYYTQARDSAAIASRFAGFSGFARFRDMKLFLMFDSFSKTDPGRSMVDPQVELLAGYDREKNTAYLRTLFCWLLNSQRAAAAARQLGVHRNTLDNRLARINELISADWGSCADSTGMLYSLFITMDRLGSLEYFG